MLACNQKPRVVEEHDSFSGIISAVEAGTGVIIGADIFGHSFGDRVKLLHITREPKPISVGIVALKGRLGPAAERRSTRPTATAANRSALNVFVTKESSMIAA